MRKFYFSKVKIQVLQALNTVVKPSNLYLFRSRFVPGCFFRQHDPRKKLAARNRIFDKLLGYMLNSQYVICYMLHVNL